MTFFFQRISIAGNQKAAGKVCAYLSWEDVAYTSIVVNYKAEKNSQEIFKY